MGAPRDCDDDLPIALRPLSVAEATTLDPGGAAQWCRLRVGGDDRGTTVEMKFEAVQALVEAERAKAARARAVALEECYLRLVKLSYDVPRDERATVDRCVAAARELAPGADELDRAVAAAVEVLRDRLSGCVTLLGLPIASTSSTRQPNSPRHPARSCASRRAPRARRSTGRRGDFISSRVG